MACKVEVKNTPPIVADYEGNLKHPKHHSRYCEEVYGCDGFAVIAQEAKPTLRRVSRTPARRLESP